MGAAAVWLCHPVGERALAQASTTTPWAHWAPTSEEYMSALSTTAVVLPASNIQLEDQCGACCARACHRTPHVEIPAASPGKYCRLPQLEPRRREQRLQEPEIETPGPPHITPCMATWSRFLCAPSLRAHRKTLSERVFLDSGALFLDGTGREFG